MERRVTGTKEWAASVYNVMNGCSNNCLYCYAKANAARFKRILPENWADEDSKDKPSFKGKRNGTIMFPSAHDITPTNYPHCEKALQEMLEADNNVLIVSKPHFVCIKQICDKFADYKDKILFRFSIGSIHDKVLEFWEPNAPNLEERLHSLEYAFERDFATSISCEPMLDWNPYKLVETVEPCVTNSIWIGKLNQMNQRMRLNNGVRTRKIRFEMNLIALSQQDVHIKEWYAQLHTNPKIKWKDEIKQIMGVKTNDCIGIDE